MIATEEALKLNITPSAVSQMLLRGHSVVRQTGAEESLTKCLNFTDVPFWPPDHLFVLSAFGDLVGLSLLPRSYSLRLLPYIIPSIEKWKRSFLRERDITDVVASDL